MYCQRSVAAAWGILARGTCERASVRASPGGRAGTPEARRQTGTRDARATRRPGAPAHPPPKKPAALTVWYGARNGRWVMSPRSRGSRPATEWMELTSSASSRRIGGRMVGRRRASIVLPKPGALDPRVRFRRHVAVRVQIVPLSEWIEEENRKGHVCACGCGKPIRVLPQHPAQAIPRYIRTHHPMTMTKEVRALREAGFLTVSEVAKNLGIGTTTLLRLQGKLFEPVPRHGKRKMRVSTAGQVEILRTELARRAGGALQTIRKRAPKVTQRPEPGSSSSTRAK